MRSSNFLVTELLYMIISWNNISFTGKISQLGYMGHFI